MRLTKDKLDALKIAVELVYKRGSDVTTMNGNYATVEIEDIINLEESLIKAFNLKSDNITFDNVLKIMAE